MSGTKSGGLKASKTNKKKHGKDFYAKIGAMGGRLGHTGGFAANPELAKKAGALGGRTSKRGKSLKTQQLIENVKQLRNAGMTNKELAKKFKVSESTIYRYLKEGE